MTKNVVKRESNRALLPGSSRQMQPAGPVQNRTSKVLAQAQTLIDELRLSPDAELVHVPITCSATGAWFILIAEKNGDSIRGIRNEYPSTHKSDGGSTRPASLSGDYKLQLPDGWACLLCGNNKKW